MGSEREPDRDEAAPRRGADRARPVLTLLPDQCRGHRPGSSSPEQPARLDAVAAAFDAPELRGRVEAVAARPASIEELTLVHDAWYVHTVRKLCDDGGGALDADTNVSPGSFEAACFAVGACLTAVEALQRRPECGGAFAAVRPPGHHALSDRAMGLCIFNNVAIAAKKLSGEGERVAIVDWDAHHGNGTQAAFWDDPSVMYVSMHQSLLFPDSGTVAETGGDGSPLGTLNLPFASGSGGPAYLESFDELVEPIVARFRPDWVIVSAGFDGHRDDPWSDLTLSADDFAALAVRARALAPSPARVLFVLEGGYDGEALRDSVRAILAGLGGIGGHERLGTES